MTLVNSLEEIEEIRPYKEFYNIKKEFLPERYPAFIEFKQHDGGLCGDFYTIKIIEIPNLTDAEQKAFIAGMKAKPEEYSEEMFFEEKINVI